MAGQTAANVLVALKREAVIGTAPATVTGAARLRIIDSPGLVLNRAQIMSGEKRSDRLTPMGRLGGKSVSGSFNTEATAGGATDIMLEAIARGAWATSIAMAFSSVTGITTGTNAVMGGGDWVAQGVRVGDIFRLSGHANVANNDVNLRVTAVSSGTITVPAGSLAVEATADTSGTLTILRKLINPTTPTRYSHAIEQYDADIDLSELFLGCRVTGVNLSFRPGAPATIAYTLMGLDRTALTTVASPFYTSPTVTTGLALIADDSLILKDGVAVASFTGLDLQFQIAASGVPVIGSFVSPDIYDNDLTISGTVTGLRSDFANLALYDAETEFSLSVLLEEPVASGAKPCLAIYLPRVKISGLQAPVGGGDGAKVETLQLMIGPRASATGHDATAVVFHTSAAA